MGEVNKKELKACPFCGRKPKVHMFEFGWQISCDIMDCPAYPSVSEDQLADAERLWNKRTETTPGVSE